MSNLFTDLPATPAAQELFATLLQRPGLRIERIVSFGQASPPQTIVVNCPGAVPGSP